jgi:hypothetical protein
LFNIEPANENTALNLRADYSKNVESSALPFKLDVNGSKPLYILGIAGAVLALGMYLLGALAIITSTITAIGILYALKN